MYDALQTYIILLLIGVIKCTRRLLKNILPIHLLGHFTSPEDLLSESYQPKVVCVCVCGGGGCTHIHMLSV